MITNTQNNLAYKYEKREKKFIAISKDELLDEIINERISDITLFYEELDNELDDKTKKIIDRFLEQMDNEKFRNIKKQDIKLIIYNNSDKVSKNLEIII
jgi:anaerobic selenocysteine-containing dehydrogenase